MHRTWVELQEQSLVNNIETIRQLTNDDSSVSVVVKANAYGHGLLEIVGICVKNRIQIFCVDSVEEAMQIRSCFSHVRIIILGYSMSENFRDIIENDLEPTIYDRESLSELEMVASKLEKSVFIHIKIETGTQRQGIPLEHLSEFVHHCKNLLFIKIKGVSTHFANLEDPNDTEFVSYQFQLFEKAKNLFFEMNIFPESFHMASSAAVMLYPQTHAQMVRAGIMLYGVEPSSHVLLSLKKTAIPCSLLPVLSWKSRVAQVKSVSAGSSIGYGCSEIVKSRSRIAILPVGYFDGYDRRLSSKGEVLIGGHRCRVLGRICMNMTIVDVSMVPQIKKDQEAILIGKDARHTIDVQTLSERCQTIPYEILSRINQKLPRLIV